MQQPAVKQHLRLPLLAQAFLRNFMSSELHLGDDDDPRSSFERKSTAPLDKSHPAVKSYSNFDGNMRIIIVSTLEPQISNVKGFSFNARPVQVFV